MNGSDRDQMTVYVIIVKNPNKTLRCIAGVYDSMGEAETVLREWFGKELTWQDGYYVDANGMIIYIDPHELNVPLDPQSIRYSKGNPEEEKQLNVSLPVTLLDRLKADAAAQKITVKELVAKALLFARGTVVTTPTEPVKSPLAPP